jgi:AhpD family alkylhydroperoxidase
LFISEVAGCDYCVPAHSLLGQMTGLAPEVLKQIRAGQPTGDATRDAPVRFVRTLAETSGTISAEEVSALKAAGSTDQQLVEVSLALAVTVFTNVFNRINDTAIDVPAVA